MSSKSRLARALQEVVVFLRAAPDSYSALWVERLVVLQNALSVPSRSGRALTELESCFGGMGTLNDLYFSDLNGSLSPGLSEAAANETFGRLLDQCFMELRLANGSTFDRIYWRWLEWRHSGELPPRIKNSFQRRAV